MTGAMLAAFRASARRTLRTRAVLISRVGFYLLILGVLSALWKAATESAGSIAGYDYAAMLWYLTTAEASVISIDPRLIEYIGSDIGTGAVGVEMLRPVSVIGMRLASSFGEALMRFAALAIPGAAFAWWQVGPPKDPAAAVVALPAIVLAIACSLAAQHAFAAMAFWVNDSKAAWFLYQKLVFLVGGMLLPLELMPDAVERAAFFTPFWAMAYAPARLMAGNFEPLLLAGQVLWLAAMLGLAAVVFGAGERKLEVAGG